MSTGPSMSHWFRPMVLQLVVVCVLVFSQLNGAQATYAQSPIDDTSDQIHLPLVTAATQMAFDERTQAGESIGQGTVPTESGDTSSGQVLAAAASATITLTSQETLWLDANKCSAEGPRGAWLSFVVTNNGTATLTNVTVTFTGFTGANASYFVTPSDLTRTFSSIGVGESFPVYYYIDYAEVCNHPHNPGTSYDGYTANYTVTVASPDLTASVVRNSTITTDEITTANAAGIAQNSILGPGTYIGQVLIQTVTYSFGNNTDLSFQPAGEANFQDECIRLVGSEITAVSGSVSTGLIGLKDQLHFPTADVPGGGGTISVTYSWEILCESVTQEAHPWATGLSGNSYKYNGFAANTILPPAQQALSVSKSVTPSYLPDATGGPVTYAVTFTNSSSVAIILQSITDQLPSCMRIANPTVGGSEVTAANSSSIPAVNATGTVTWVGKHLGTSANTTYRVAANDTLTLIYTADVSSCPAPSTQVNSVTGLIGTTTVGPATATLGLGVIVPNISLTKSNDADQDGTFSNVETVPGNASYPYDVTYQLTIINNTTAAGTISSIADNKTDITTATATQSPTCASLVGTTINANAALTCYYDVTFTDATTAQVINIAEATVTNAAGSDTQNDAATVNFTQNPALLLVKTASPTTYDAVNTNINYSYAVTNTGNVALAGPVTVTDDKATVTCPAVSTVGNNNGNLDPGESITCTTGYNITQADLDNGSVTNTATADAGGTDSNEDQETVTANQNAALDVKKVLTQNGDEDTSGTVSAGDTLTYTITATNTGNVTLNNVMVSDDLTGDFISCTAVAPSATCVLTVTYVASQADANAGKIVNTGTADSDETDPTDDTVTIPIIQADLSLTKTVNNATPAVGSTIIFTISVANAGPSTATGVAVEDVVPAGFLTITNISNSGTEVNNVVSWSGLTIAANDSIDLTFRATVNASSGITGEYTNVAQVNASDQSDPDSTPGNNVATEDDQDSVDVTPRGSIYIAKGTIGGNGTFEFDTNRDADNSADFTITTIGGTGSDITELKDILPGDYRITELIPAGWALTDSWCMSPLGKIVYNNADVIVDLAPGQIVQCTYINIKLGSITIEKATLGGTGTFDFDSTFDGLQIDGNADFSVATTAGTNPESRTFTNLTPGNYTVSELIAPGWSLTGLTCNGDADNDSVINPDSGTVAINLDAGEDITCTFENTKHGSITIVKQLADAAGLDRAFDFSSSTLDDNRFSLTTSNGSVSRTFNTLLPDTYDISEVVPTGWQLTNISCEGGTTSEIAIGNNGVTIDLVAGENLTCTFTNDPLPTATVSKSAATTSLDELGGPVTFAITVTNLSASEALTLTTLTDAPFGDITAVAGAITATNCSVPQTIVASGSYNCTFSVNLQGEPGDYTDTVTATLTDNDGNTITPSDDATVTVVDVLPTAEVTKVATPTSLPEPGGPVTFTVTVANLSTAEALTLTTLVDVPFGEITSTHDDITATNCSVPQLIAIGGTYSCRFTVNLQGRPGDYSDTVTATLTDDDGNTIEPTGDATVTLKDVDSGMRVVKSALPAAVPEEGGVVTFTVEVVNISLVDTITITGLNDSIYGAVCGKPLNVTLAPNESYTCEFVRFIEGETGEVHTNVATVTAVDDDGNEVTGNDDAQVNIVDTPSTLHIHKQANVSEVLEPGGDVTFEVVIENTSSVDKITLETVVDDRFGDISASCTPGLPVVLELGDMVTCRFTERIVGNAGDLHVNVVTATGTDDDSNKVSDSDQEEVRVDNVPSSIKVLKVSDPTSVPEPGALVTFTVFVTNTSAVDDVIIQQLVDDRFGNLNTLCGIPDGGATLAPGAALRCLFTRFVEGNAGGLHTNVVTATGIDDEQNPVQDFDVEHVDILDLPSALMVTKLADRNTVPESGALVTFTVTAQNASLVDAITVNTVVDSVFGDISDSCLPALPALIVPGESIECSFSALISGTVGSTHRNVATVSGIDDDEVNVTGSDDAEVDIIDVPSSIKVSKTASPTSVPEPGGEVTFSVMIENTSAVDTVFINRVEDNKFGDLRARCAIPDGPLALEPGAKFECSFTEFVGGATGSIHHNVITVTGIDDDEMPVSDFDDEKVGITDLLPDITVSKRAQPTFIPESGAQVTFTVAVVNNSLVEAVTLQSLVDSVYGDLNGLGSCVLPQTLAANGGAYQCTFSRFVTGDVSADHINVVTATATDDEENPVSDSDDALIVFGDVLPTIEVVKSATPEAVLETGEPVTFTVQVINTGNETVTVTSLVDDRFGDLNGLGNCTTQQAIGIGATYTCRFTRTLAGAAGTAHINVVEAVTTDNEGNTVSDTDDATVTFGSVDPFLDAFKEVELLIDTFNNPKDAGKITPGDTLRYHIELVNQGNGLASGVILEDIPDAKTSLITGSVTTTKGTILEGNDEGDTKLVVSIGTVEPNRQEIVRITFDVLIDPNIESTILSNQALVNLVNNRDTSGTSTMPTDDPTTAKEDDPTFTEVVLPPTALPGEAEPTAPRLHAIFLPVVLR